MRSYEPTTTRPALTVPARNRRWQFVRSSYQNTWAKRRVDGDKPATFIGAEENLPKYVRDKINKTKL